MSSPASGSANFQTVFAAIRAKQTIFGEYGGFPRSLCQRCLGYGKGGEEMALFYQFAGSSRSGSVPEWKCMRLRGLTITSVQDGPWHTSDDHSRPQSCVKQIVAEVSF